RREPELAVRPAGRYAHAVSHRPIRRRFLTAGALWAPAALAALALLAPTAHAQQADLRRKPVTEPPAGVAVPPGPPLHTAALPGGTTSNAGGTPTTGVIPLRQLAADSLVVVDGVVSRTDTFDDGRLVVYRVQAQQTLRGTPVGGEIAVIETRSGAARPGWLADGARAILLLRQARSLSYFSQLPSGTYYEPTAGRDGVVRLGPDAEHQTISTVLADAARIATFTDESESRRARRELAFRELASDVPRLAGDALLELRLIDGLSHLTHDEIAALEGTLASKDVP